LSEGLTDGEEKSEAVGLDREGTRGDGGCSTAEELLLFHLVQTTALGRR
jgi:hypothetical protein